MARPEVTGRRAGAAEVADRRVGAAAKKKKKSVVKPSAVVQLTQPTVQPTSYTRSEFCLSRRISESTYFALKRKGWPNRERYRKSHDHVQERRALG
jgi:hypothetical protein